MESSPAEESADAAQSVAEPEEAAGEKAAPQPEEKDDVQPALNLRHKTDPAAMGDGMAPEDSEEVHMYNGVKVGRNDPCPCGSGKKFKKCCGKNL